MCNILQRWGSPRPSPPDGYADVAADPSAPSSPCTMSTSSSRASSRRSLTTTRLNSDCASSSPSAVRNRASTCSGVSVPATHQPRPEGLAAGRGDEHLKRLGHRLADLPRALDLDLEHHRLAAAQPALELGAQGAVAAPGVRRVLDELAVGDAAIELVGTEKVIVDAVGLPRPRSARRRRHREAQLGHALEQPANERPLADAGRTGDHEDSGHRRRDAVAQRRRSSATSSPRWRSESPPRVLLGEILHWDRILLTLTRPYLGTASSRSNTLAVCR